MFNNTSNITQCTHPDQRLTWTGLVSHTFYNFGDISRHDVIGQPEQALYEISNYNKTSVTELYSYNASNINGDYLDQPDWIFNKVQALTNLYLSN